MPAKKRKTLRIYQTAKTRKVSVKGYTRRVPMHYKKAKVSK